METNIYSIYSPPAMVSEHPLLLGIIKTHDLQYESDTIYDDPASLYSIRVGLARPRLIDKPWGAELLTFASPKFFKKILFVDAGEDISLQYHERKTEAMREIGTGEGTAHARALRALLLETEPFSIKREWLMTRGNSGQVVRFLAEHFPTRDSLISRLKTGQISPRMGELYISPFTLHTIHADTDLALAETSTPEVDDVVRVSDLYGRTDQD